MATLAVAGVMHEADDTYSIRSTWSCYWLDQFLTLALKTWISSGFSIFHCICLLFTVLILVSVELPLCIVVTIPECYNLLSGVKLSIRLFCFITRDLLDGLPRAVLENNPTQG